MKEVTQKECYFVLLCKLPNNDIHQVLIEQEYLQYAISQSNSFKLNSEKIEHVIFDIPKNIEK